MKQLVILLIVTLYGVTTAPIWAARNCNNQSTQFIAFGDFGMGNPTQKRVARAMESFCQSEPCDFALLLGDNIYPDGVDSPRDPQWKRKFEDPYRKLEINFYPSLGNHDYRGNIEAQIQYSKVNEKWKMPNRYYFFSKCHIDFFVIDTEDFDSDQADWLLEKILKSRAPWKVVYGHRPVFSHGGHGNNNALKKELLPLLMDQVDFYLAGHDHHLEYISKGYRPDFIVSGSAAESRPVEKGKSNLFAESIPGFAHFKFTKTKSTIQFVSENAKSLFTHQKRKRNR